MSIPHTTATDSVLARLLRCVAPNHATAKLLGRSTWGLADQMLISATNFLTMVLLARGLGPAAFGTYVLLYTVLQFANSLQGALILQPHNVLGATRQGSDYTSYTATTAVAQAAFALVVAGLILAAALFCWANGWSISSMLFALSPAALAWQLREFARRALYTELRLRAAFVNDIISYGGQATILAGLWWWSGLSAPLALLVIAGTSAAAFLWGLVQLRKSLSGPIDFAALRENWHYGKWLGGAEIGYWLSSQAYLYLTGLLLGAASAGVLKAAYVVFGPTRVLSFFLRTVLPTHFARALDSAGDAGLHAQLRGAYTIAAPLLGTYCLMVLVFAEPLIGLLYGEAYSGSGPVLMWYAVFAFVAFMASIVNSALRAKRLTRHVFAAQMAATLTLPIGWLCIRGFGTEGAVVGMIITSLTVNSLLWRAYIRHGSRRILFSTATQPLS